MKIFLTCFFLNQLFLFNSPSHYPISFPNATKPQSDSVFAFYKWQFLDDAITKLYDNYHNLKDGSSHPIVGRVYVLEFLHRNGTFKVSERLYVFDWITYSCFTSSKLCFISVKIYSYFSSSSYFYIEPNMIMLLKKIIFYILSCYFNKNNTYLLYWNMGGLNSCLW